ncbi:MAG: excinuclease ABC subunit C [Acidobacteria bacterium RIFCSPLOWO2_12_FULL_65_11]|nr:MAG: excinuclease ABC subunit C [Acidobacteria bacterium RIFCSPLOWO2_02_FULL_64_15]OFW33831.1 MAG: excinuclease ABC subunit C [Acidobacteria bacterium RIFCSPLOWO2_12_FULL_65_11]
MPIHELKEQIARLPAQPGVYLYFNADGATIYVGKARVLRDRVRSYLKAAGSSPKTDALLADATRLEVIVTDSVVEALALENNLIKQRSPRYNILLRDDKSYPYLQLTTNEAFPRVLVARRVERDGSVYAGPFLPAQLARRTMGLTHRLFGVRSCNEVITGRRGRPCLEYDIKRCIAPCVDTICSAEEYARAVKLTELFLVGRNDELLTQLKGRMLEAAGAERFEEAAHLRDATRTVQALHDRQQKMATPELGHRDVFGVKVGPAGAVVQVFQVRSGRVVERLELGTAEAIVGAQEGDVMAAALQQFYEPRGAPSEIHVPAEPDEREALEHWLSARAGRRVRIITPRRGEKRGLVDLANRNAALAYQTRFSPTTAALDGALETLRRVLALAALPRRIECFDISTIQGSETVASMVVCEDGRMRRGEYRKYRIRWDSGFGIRDSEGPKHRASKSGKSPIPNPQSRQDDFAAMHEVVLRRYRKAIEQGGPFPDLIVIDGGKGQLSAAYAALEELGLANLVAVGIAKKEELLFTRDRDDGLRLAESDPGLLLIERVRDEAHRFAVTFHRRARTMRDLRSDLDRIPHIGPRRRRLLLTTFGSVTGVRRATREELTGVVGAKAADRVLAFFGAEP